MSPLSRIIFIHSQIYHHMFHTGSIPVQDVVTDAVPDGPLGGCFNQ